MVLTTTGDRTVNWVVTGGPPEKEVTGSLFMLLKMTLARAGTTKAVVAATTVATRQANLTRSTLHLMDDW